jgi:long-chain acyl-CoA synthetase
VEVKRRFEEITSGKLVEGYGLTKAPPATHLNPIHGTNKPGDIGIPIPDTLPIIVDDDGNVLPPEEVGELAIYGLQVVKAAGPQVVKGCTGRCPKKRPRRS